MRTRRLSSGLTFIGKFLFPAFFGIIVLLVTGAWLSLAGHSMDAGQPGLLAWPVFLVWAGFVTIFVLQAIALKRVRIDTSTLHISNYIQEIQVPFPQIAEVTQRRWLSLHSVTIRFRQPTAFGDAIRFKPRLYPWFWREHPVVAELRELANGASLTPAQLDQAIARDRKGLLLVAGLFVLFFVGIMFLVQVLFRHSDAYALGLKTVTQDPAVMATLGIPIEPGLFIGGHLSEGSGTGCAVLDFSLHGSHEEGEAHVVAIKANSVWRLSRASVKPDSATQAIEIANEPPTDAQKSCLEEEVDGPE